MHHARLRSAVSQGPNKLQPVGAAAHAHILHPVSASQPAVDAPRQKPGFADPGWPSDQSDRLRIDRAIQLIEQVPAVLIPVDKLIDRGEQNFAIGDESLVYSLVEPAVFVAARGMVQ